MSFKGQSHQIFYVEVRQLIKTNENEKQIENRNEIKRFGTTVKSAI